MRCPFAPHSPAGRKGPRRERERFALLERWRDRIIDETDGLQAFVAEYPGAPRDSLAALVADARGERARGAPPRKSRALFRELARIIENK